MHSHERTEWVDSVWVVRRAAGTAILLALSVALIGIVFARSPPIQFWGLLHYCAAALALILAIYQPLSFFRMASVRARAHPDASDRSDFFPKLLGYALPLVVIGCVYVFVNL